MGSMGELRGTVVRDLEQVFGQGTGTGLAEGQLLRRFVMGRDEAAFSTIVSRHGPMVMGVCRRVLATASDTEDAFQATFLVLLRRAAALEDVDCLGPWLYGVAWRVASRARAESARRRLEEEKAASARPESGETGSTADQRELGAVLDEEINRLPEKYRRPIVLCYMEGLSQDAAARRLRWKAGVLRGRLDRARDRLRGRLARRGFAPAAALAAMELLAQPTQAALPATLLTATCEAAIRDLTVGKVAGAVAVSSATRLAGVVLRRQALRWAGVAAVLVVTGTLALAALTRLGQPEGNGEPSTTPQAATAPVPVASPKPKPGPPAGRTIVFHVVDKTSGQPLTGARLTVSVGSAQTVDRTTDETGAITFDYPLPRPRMMRVNVNKQNFAPMVVWVRHPNFEDEFPAIYTLALPRALPLSGVVNDEDGRPVAGARVSPSFFYNSNELPPGRDEYRLGDNFPTDAAGRWTCPNMPSGYDPARLAIQVQHSDFEPFQIYGGKVREMVGPSGTLVLKRGITVTGRVVDRDNRPVPGARVSAGLERWGSGLRKSETDRKGRFRLEHLPAGESALTAEAKGHGPDLVKLDIRPGLAPVELKLGLARTVAGLVVDSQGKPLADVQVLVDGWRRFRTLDWEAKTGSDGRFRWEDAPRESVWITAYQEGLIAIRNREVGPSEGVALIKMNRALTISGTVVDSRTSRPIEAFALTPGVDQQNGFSTYWERNMTKQRSGGRYEIELTESAESGHRLRIEADGYAPGISRPIHDGEENPKVDFELVAGEAMTGLVKLASGKPVEGADVVLVVPSQPAFIENGRPPTGLDHRVVKTGPDGRYAFPAIEPPFTILALDERGFAQVRSQDLVRNQELVLKPWGRIEGTLRVGSQPGAGLPVLVNGGPNGDTDQAIPWFQYSAAANASGQFIFDRVVPGSMTVARKIALGAHSYSSAGTTEIDVKPGQTARVTIGGSGRPVIGRVVVPEGLRQKLDWGYSLNQLGHKPSLWNQALGRIGIGSSHPGSDYAVRVEPDGSFRIDDVIAGHYGLKLMLQEPPASPNQVAGGEMIGGAHRDVTIDEIPGGRSDEPLDLGAIPLVPTPPRKVVKVSEPAPGFRVDTLHGEPLDLANYRGKYVLLDFWATWCGPCCEETPELKATFDAFGNDRRFAMIGLSLDQFKAAPKAYAEKHDLRWTQGFLGDWSQTKLPEAYGVNAIPAIWLIGPDGTVIAKDLRGKGISKAVAKALGKQ